MTTNPTPDLCPNCQHPRHLPGAECSTHVNHGPSRFHLCLCLARPGAALPCPPLMTCQGGTLGYADIWYLQQGHTLTSGDGEISPEVLGVASVGFPSSGDEQPAAVSSPPAADRATLRAAVDRALRISERDPNYEMTTDPYADGWTECRETFRDALLAALPPAARAAVLREVADWLKAWRPEFFERWAVVEQDRYEGGVDDAAAELRRMADEAQQPEPTTADKAAALGMTDAEYRAHSQRAAVDAIRAAIPGLYATVGLRVEDVLADAPAVGARQPDTETREADPDCERCDGSGLDPDAYFVEGDVWTHAPCSECLPEDDDALEPAPERVKHSGPNTRFCVLCLSGEHERVDDDQPAGGAGGVAGETGQATAAELAHAIDNSTPYPVELDPALCTFMAERLLEMLTVSKRPAHAVWQPEEPPGPSPEPMDPETLSARLRCPQCGEDITDYDEDDHVFRTGDERPYCSGECIIAMHRAIGTREKAHAEGEHAFCGDECAEADRG